MTWAPGLSPRTRLGSDSASSRPRDSAGDGVVFANVDEFKESAVGEAMEESEVRNGLQNLLAAPSFGRSSGQQCPFADARLDAPRNSPGPHRPEPEVVGSPKDEGIDNKVNQIQKSAADIRRLLQAMQEGRK